MSQQPSQQKAIRLENAYTVVVEDTQQNFAYVGGQLHSMGVRALDWKTSGYQVVMFAEKLPNISLIMMNISLPYEDGYQAIQKIRAHSRLKDTIVCAVTTKVTASEEEMQKAQNSGFDGFLVKPFHSDHFPEQIRRLLSGESVWK